MSSYLDIIGGALVGGIIMLIALVNADLGVRRMYNYNAEAILQSNLARMTEIIEYDLQKMGFGLPDTVLTKTIQIHDSDRLKFLAQLNKLPETSYQIAGLSGYDAEIDTIEYRILTGMTIDIADTNVTLYRVMRKVTIAGGPSESIDLGYISQSDVFEYRNQAGYKTGVTQEIRIVDVSLTALNPDIMITPELVSEEFGGIADETYRRQELQRLLKPVYWKNRSVVVRNLMR